MAPIATRLSRSHINLSVILLFGTLAPYCGAAESGVPVEPDQTWAGHRVVTWKALETTLFRATTDNLS
jgi:hypothetical protein